MNTMIIDVQHYLRSSISNLLRQPMQGSSTVSLLNDKYSSESDFRSSTNLQSITVVH